MTGSKHNHEGNSGDSGEPEPGPYWKRMHRDWRFWIGALFMAAATRRLRSQRRSGMGSTRTPATGDARNRAVIVAPDQPRESVARWHKPLQGPPLTPIKCQLPIS